MNMIEKVCRALARKDNIYHFDRDSDLGWEQMIENVRATIEAMRDPTNQMEIAGGSKAPDDVTNGDCREIYSAMIDAALSEPLDEPSE